MMDKNLRILVSVAAGALFSICVTAIVLHVAINMKSVQKAKKNPSQEWVQHCARVSENSFNRRIFWTQNIDCNNPIKNLSTQKFEQKNDIYSDNCALYLPDTYTADGTPTKLILFCKQGDSEITPSQDPIMSQCAFFVHLGYAVLGVEGIPSELCKKTGIGKRTVGNYIHAKSMSQAYKTVIHGYNIDSTGCYAYGWSQGGHTLQNLLDNTNLPIIAAAAQSPVVSMRYHQWDLHRTATHNNTTFDKDARLSIARLFDFAPISTNNELENLQYDATKTNGWDPFTTNVDNPYNGFVQGTCAGDNLWGLPDSVSVADITMVKKLRSPIKIWVADNDNSLGADVVKVYVKAVQNSGQTAEIRVFTIGGHNISRAQKNIGTFTVYDTTCNLKPLYLEMGQWFERYNGYSTHGYNVSLPDSLIFYENAPYKKGVKYYANKFTQWVSRAINLR